MIPIYADAIAIATRFETFHPLGTGKDARGSRSNKDRQSQQRWYK